MSRQSRARHTAARRRRSRLSAGHPQPDALAPRCPHCASPHVGWLTRAEFSEVLAVHGVELRPDVDVETEPVLDITPFPYWFCHACESGGALVVF